MGIPGGGVKPGPIYRMPYGIKEDESSTEAPIDDRKRAIHLIFMIIGWVLLIIVFLMGRILSNPSDEGVFMILLTASSLFAFSAAFLGKHFHVNHGIKIISYLLASICLILVILYLIEFL